MSHLRKLVHTARMPIRWGDMDCDGPRQQHRVLPLHGTDPHRVAVRGIGAYEGQGPVIVNASCTFHVPLTYPGEAEVRMFVGPPGKSSVESYYEIWMDGKKYADGSAKLVWIDMKTTKSAPLPEALR